MLSKNFLQIDMRETIIETSGQRIELGSSEKEIHLASKHEKVLNIEYSTQRNIN